MGPSGLQIPFRRSRQITQGSVASKIVDFSAAYVTVDYVDAGSIPTASSAQRKSTLCC